MICSFQSSLAKQGLPAIVVRILIFMYEEQKGCVKLGNLRSKTFNITNGTRQGSVYLDDLLVKLRARRLGCHIGDYWLGTCCYADDIILLAPCRDILQKMFNICDDYASDHNLEFSTDTVPSNSKSKCIYFFGRLNRVKYPDPVKLAGKELPWVVTAEHLGHTLSQQVNMDKDCQRAKSKFIAKSSEQLKFAQK